MGGVSLQQETLLQWDSSTACRPELPSSFVRDATAPRDRLALDRRHEMDNVLVLFFLSRQLVMATNPPKGDDHRVGAVRDRSQTYNPKTEHWTKRDAKTGSSSTRRPMPNRSRASDGRSRVSDPAAQNRERACASVRSLDPDATSTSEPPDGHGQFGRSITFYVFIP